MWCWCDDFGVKYDQKESHNMILMSKNKGQHGEKKGQQIPPLFSGNAQKKSIFIMVGVLLVHDKH